MLDFNILTMNSKAYPATEPLVAQLGQRIRIRFGNLSAMDHHPIHLHGFQTKLTESDGDARSRIRRDIPPTRSSFP